ncbi:MAG: hypothetical protein WCF95_05550 [bacterium]
MKNQYLVISESLVYKNNKLTAINMYDQFLAMQLPAEFDFDLAVLCGPGWAVGDYSLDIFIEPKGNESFKLGVINFDIPSENFVYNAVAQDLSLLINEGVEEIAFVVKNKEEILIRRNFMVNILE